MVEEIKKENEEVEIEKKEEIKKKSVKKSEDLEQGLLDKVRENPFVAATIVLGLVVAILLFNSFVNVTGSTITGNVVAEGEVTESITSFILAQTSGQGGLKELNDFNDYFYEAIIVYQGQEIPLYVTKDGEYFVQGLTPLDRPQQTTPPQQQEPAEISKSDKPVVELFIMTHCPYGTQAEKGMIPVLELLGDKVEGDIRFVHYFMHEPEETETPRQVCIREEQPIKWYNYLRYFLEEGDANYAMGKAGASISQVQTCVDNGNSEGYYKSDSELSENYGVKGSPTLVINGQQVTSGRDPASYLSAICSAFNEAPEECDTELSSASPSPMWGWDATGTDSGEQC